MKEKYHFIGIGGIGMSGLARILMSRNVPVSGSDIASSYVTEGLVKAGAKVFIGHSAQYVSPETSIVYSSDIKTENPEYKEGLKQNCTMLHRSDLLCKLMEGYKTLAVAGTHGKTTTSSLLTVTVVEAGLDPSYAIGGVINQLHSNANHGDGKYFVAEADESDGTFLKYKPYGAIITNIDLDHMNHFGTEEVLCQAFDLFAKRVTSHQHLFWCGDDVRLQKLSLPGFSYGIGQRCDLRASNIVQKGWRLVFDVDFQGVHYPKVEVALIGRHNVLNALSVFGFALSIGIPEEVIRRAFSAFGGVKRRCEKKGEARQVLAIDDYAHHPTEIKTTLDGLRAAIGDQRLIAVFQPHRYSRTKDCLGSYGGIFDAADELFITDIYGAGEAPIPGLTSALLLQEVQSFSPLSCRLVSRDKLCESLAAFVRPQDVVVTLGAGDITKLGAELIDKLRQQ